MDLTRLAISAVTVCAAAGFPTSRRQPPQPMVRSKKKEAKSSAGDGNWGTSTAFKSGRGPAAVAKGVVAGVLGVGVKPVVGLFDLASKLTQGIHMKVSRVVGRLHSKAGRADEAMEEAASRSRSAPGPW